MIDLKRKIEMIGFIELNSYNFLICSFKDWMMSSGLKILLKRSILYKIWQSSGIRSFYSSSSFSLNMATF